MTWWRRDPNFAPVQRYAQRILRSDDAALRTRCFSRTPSKSAQHEHDHGNKRPSGMSNLEWMQRQQYQQWRKKLMDDPYQALFGASNDMLSGKGLKDWEWLTKSFPQWMLREVESHDDKTLPSKHIDNNNLHSKYPRRVEIKNEEPDTRRQRESHFPQPSFRASQLLPDDSTGIESPSDLRRPREQPRVKVVGRHPEALTETTASAVKSTSSADVPLNDELQQPTPPKSSEWFEGYITKTKTDAATKIEQSSKAASSTEGSFMDRFLTEQPEHNDTQTDTVAETGSWRETTLQRRSVKDVIAKPDVDLASVSKADDEPSTSVSSTEATHGTVSVPPTEDHLSSSPTSPGLSTTRRLSTQEQLPEQERAAPQGSITSARSTSRILSQLPEDDLDFLSADDIRANMAARRSKVLSEESRKAQRAELEKTFENAHKANNGIDPMLESKIINDQYVRRIERQMQQPESSYESQGLNEPQTTAHTDRTPYTADESQLESSVERMKSWLEESGAKFASLFWQDPTEAADAKKTRLFFDKILARIRKGRLTMIQVIEDLETDIPASKPLLKRMKADENLLDSAINALRQRSVPAKIQSLSPKKVRAIQELRLRYQSTDNDLTKAYALLEEAGKSDAAKNVSPAFKRRVSIASKIIQKNAHLTRYLIWSLQARLEDPEIDQSMLANYKAVANSLLTLRDTQMALSRLLERAMLVHGVTPQTWENITIFSGSSSVGNSHEDEQPSQSGTSSIMSEVDKAQLRAKIAADERLANEVDAQKSAMRGLSDDGYARMPQTVSKKSFEERGPLAHSLFRPFGPVLQSLKSETPSKVGVTETEEGVVHARNDDTLIDDTQRAHKDTDGLKMVDDKKPASLIAESKVAEDRDGKKFEMLKDDPTLGDISTQANELNLPEPMSRAEVSSTDTASEAVQNTPTAAHTLSSPEYATLDPELGKVPDATIVESSPHSAEVNLPTLYTILVHDPHTGRLSLTTSTSTAPSDVSPAMPLHEALSKLDQPAKFIPYIKDGLEIVTVKNDMLILRDARNPTSSIKSFETVETSTAKENTEDTVSAFERSNINPIDGTARLSPTGYVGPEESPEQLEREFTERRQAAERVVSIEDSSSAQQRFQQENTGKKKSGKGAGIVKTAIWAAALCYVAGVLGELAS